MVFKKLHLGTAAYSSETFDEIQLNLKQYFNAMASEGASGAAGSNANNPAKSKRTRKTAVTRYDHSIVILFGDIFEGNFRRFLKTTTGICILASDFSW